MIKVGNSIARGHIFRKGCNHGFGLPADIAIVHYCVPFREGCKGKLRGIEVACVAIHR